MQSIRESLSDRLYDEKELYAYIERYAAEKELAQTAYVLPYAAKMHEGQYRRGRDRVPYIYHPLLVACHAIALGLDEDDVISAALLHDTCEDCGVKPQELPVNARTQHIVALLTREATPGKSGEEIETQYFGAIMQDPIASIIKLLDRCCNVSGMTTGFSKEGMIRYIASTQQWIYPLIRETKRRFPQYAREVFLIEYHLTSVVETILHQL